MGSPPKDYYVQIDTGSDVLWVSCGSCNGCPETSGLPVWPHFLTSIPFLVSMLLSLWKLRSHMICCCKFQTTACNCYRFSLIPLILEAHQRHSSFLVLIEGVVLEFNPQIPIVPLRTISVRTRFSMEMAVGHQAIMYRICCILRRFSRVLWPKILQLPLSLGERHNVSLKFLSKFKSSSKFSQSILTVLIWRIFNYN